MREPGVSEQLEALRTRANQRILDAAQSSIAHGQEWDFFWECGHPDCQEYVSLTVRAYGVIPTGTVLC